MTKKNEFRVSCFEINKPFKNYSGNETSVGITIHLDEIVDGYDYHDFPNSEDVWLNKEQVEALIYRLQLRLKEMNALDENGE